MVKIPASKEGIEKINQCREDKRWTKDENSEAMIITSQQQFRQAVAGEKKLPIEDFTIEQLESLVKKKIFTPDSTNQVWEYINRLKSKNTLRITIERFLQVIESKEIHTKGITYRNWQKFLQGKEIEQDVFIAFCEALGIEDWKSVAVLPLIYTKDSTKQTRLVEGLSLFNHQRQIDLLLSNLANQKRAFLIANPCHYSRTWMLKRLETEISVTMCLKCKPISLTGSQYSSLRIGELKNRFHTEYCQAKLVKTLKQENLLFILDIDTYDLERLEQLIIEFWQPLVSQVPKNAGMLLMFLLASHCNNDWQEKWHKSSTLSEHITELPPANPFEANDVAQVLPRIALKLGQQLLGQEVTIANCLINKSQGETEKLLLEIYRYFECRTTEFSLWQRYP
ncbi:hypothetical protein [Brasilonema sp. UFV-L1]|uniref:hypothetical protein n=1 Tax=Brasilonema sp. UFV-L1 TaxID=2234130 RepID=UPI00145CAFA1|nr:hypothetical protein [Brasilonema sp. UFV-L1]NMG09577.1 hypothetical protein [Brasilonema sp. UFV-L1]